jgi:hypothetical protein
MAVTIKGHPAAGIPSASIPLLPLRRCSGCVSRRLLKSNGCPTVDASLACGWYCREWGAGDFALRQDFPACNAWGAMPPDLE